MNFMTLDVAVSDDRETVTLTDDDGFTYTLRGDRARKIADGGASTVRLGIRPENVHITEGASGENVNEAPHSSASTTPSSFVAGRESRDARDTICGWVPDRLVSGRSVGLYRRFRSPLVALTRHGPATGARSPGNVSSHLLQLPSMDDGSLEDLLQRFGFSDKEVDTYLTILELGEAKASPIADEAGVSKRYVYSIAETLEDRGFVEVNDHVVPTTIRANQPEDVVDSLTGDLQEMRPALESRFSRTAPRSESFEVVKSRVTVLKRVSELVDRAEVEVTLAIPYRLVDEVAEQLRAAVERDVLVVLLVTGVNPEDDLELDGMASVARAWDQPMPTMLTVDQQAGIIAPGEMLSQSNSASQAIVFAQEQLGPVIVGSFLGNYLPMATEVYTADPTELPATYQEFRHAVLAATLHLRANDEVRARITGRAVGDEEFTELKGVVDVRQGLLEPATNDLPVENTLFIETDEGTVSVGGLGAFVEDFEARQVELLPSD